MGGTESVAALTGGVRMCNFGGLWLRSSAEVVSKRRRLGTLGGFGGGRVGGWNNPALPPAPLPDLLLEEGAESS